MSQAARVSASFLLEEPWRIAWIAPLAVALWMGLLLLFALLLKETAAPPPEVKPIEARIVEIPPAAGLQSSAPAAPIAPPKPRPQLVRKPVAHPPPHLSRPRPIAPVAPPSTAGTAKAETPPSAAAPATSEAPDRGGANLGVGTDNAGARALYAPLPEIPDELRENALVAVAVAHFKIGYDGRLEVSLAQPTDSPRLNEILLDTLKTWRFAPAIKGGVAIESEFDLRIPITVQ
jgi:protein TonB